MIYLEKNFSRWKQKKYLKKKIVESHMDKNSNFTPLYVYVCSLLKQKIGWVYQDLGYVCIIQYFRPENQSIV